MATLKLTNSAVTAEVDDDSHAWLSGWKWQLIGNRYVGRYDSKRVGPPLVYLHRQVVWAAAGQQVDHIDGNRLNNRRGNLRICDASQNCANRGKTKRNTSGHKWVTWNKHKLQWQAQFKFKGRTYFVGRGVDPAELYAMCLKKAREVAGEFVRG